MPNVKPRPKNLILISYLVLVVLTFFLLCLGVICCLCKCQLVDQSISLLLIFLSFIILLSVLFSIYLSFFKVYLFVLSSLDKSLGSTSAWKVGGLLCILTGERVPFAGRNHFFGVKTRIKDSRGAQFKSISIGTNATRRICHFEIRICLALRVKLL